MGKTPKDALTDFVISQFKWQLLYTEKSIKEIGWEYGFLDENNFSSFFYKEVGITPKEFRRSRIIQK
jgi:AraC-like DNA-binding protein